MSRLPSNRPPRTRRSPRCNDETEHTGGLSFPGIQRTAKENSDAFSHQITSVLHDFVLHFEISRAGTCKVDNWVIFARLKSGGEEVAGWGIFENLVRKH